MTDRDAPRTSAYEPGTGNVPDEARREELRRRVTASRAAQGLPPYITDPAVLDRIADLLMVTLGCSDRRRRAHPRPLSAAGPRQQPGRSGLEYEPSHWRRETRRRFDAQRPAAPPEAPPRMRALASAWAGALWPTRMAGSAPSARGRRGYPGHPCRTRRSRRAGDRSWRRGMAHAERSDGPRAVIAGVETRRSDTVNQSALTRISQVKQSARQVQPAAASLKARAGREAKCTGCAPVPGRLLRIPPAAPGGCGAWARESA
jgi:hypothetical protein